MTRTHFHDTTRDDGSPVTVGFSYRSLSATHAEVEIIDVMPNTPEFGELCNRSLALHMDHPHGPMSSAPDSRVQAAIDALDRKIDAAKSLVKLTDAEDERITAHLIETHVYEPDDDFEGVF